MIKPVLLSCLLFLFHACHAVLLLFVFHASHAVLSVPCSLVVICWERADLLALLGVMFSCVFCHLPIYCPGLCEVFDYIDS